MGEKRIINDEVDHYIHLISAAHNLADIELLQKEVLNNK